MNSLFTLFLFVGEIILIYFLTRLVLKRAYSLLSRIGNKKIIVGIISILYEPGTIVHELSHYFVALLLNMHPQEVSIFPVIERNKIKLGHVLYQKNKGDFIRPILVGIAPFFGAMITLWLIVYAHQFPGKELWQTGLFGYFILAITANMFSSQRDLVDIGYLIPPGLLVALFLYLFPLQIPPNIINQLMQHISYFIQTIQPALLFSLAFHAILIALLSRLR